MTTHYTVVYTIHDREAFEETRKRLNADMKPSEGEPFAITAISCDHEIQRCHWYEVASETVDDDLLRDTMDDIASRVDIGSIESLDDL
jgi:hypothetical protein